MIKGLLFSLFKLFFIRHYYRYCYRKIEELPEETQLFFVTRRDFGTYILLLIYLKVWNRKRGKTALVVLTGYLDVITELVGVACPETLLIGPENTMLKRMVSFFGARRVHLECLTIVYARLVIDFPRALFLFHQPSRYPYPDKYTSSIPHLDKNLYQEETSFVAAYKKCRNLIDYREDTIKDLYALMTDSLKVVVPPPIPGRYVVININCKDYSRQDPSANRKKIYHPERYDALIDWLVSKGLTVVLQGRSEQPCFQPRKGLIDTSKDANNSPARDVALYSGAFFAITTKTGPENFATLCGTPLLGLNYVELTMMTPHKKMRFYPKHISKDGRRLSWQELLEHPSYFDLGKGKFDVDIVYEELESRELIDAAAEFLEIVETEKWSILSNRQESYIKSLCPLHLDLFYAKSIPCDIYLREPK